MRMLQLCRILLLMTGVVADTVATSEAPIHPRRPFENGSEGGNYAQRIKHRGVHRHGNRVGKGSQGAWKGASEMDKLVVDSRTGVSYNPYSKHHPGRHVCTLNPERPRQAYCKPTFKNYVIRCQGNQICKGVRLVYETRYEDAISKSNEVTYACCPGWTQIGNRNHGCNKPSCSKPCLNGGKCVKPELCACLKGFAGQQCEIDLNIPICQKPCLNEGKCIQGGLCSCPKGFGGVQCEIDLNKPKCSAGCENGGTCVHHEVCRCPGGFSGRHCELDVDECEEEKPCDHICHNVPGSFRCQCKEDFALQSDGQSCRKEGDEGGLEAKDLEFEILDRRLLKLETMMDESHKNDVSKVDLDNVYKDMDAISKDIGSLKNKMNDVENYKNDLFNFKSKLNTIERKAEKVDELVLKYDRMKKCAFYNKICI